MFAASSSLSLSVSPFSPSRSSSMAPLAAPAPVLKSPNSGRSSTKRVPLSPINNNANQSPVHFNFGKRTRLSLDGPAKRRSMSPGKRPKLIEHIATSAPAPAPAVVMQSAAQVQPQSRSTPGPSPAPSSAAVSQAAAAELVDRSIKEICLFIQSKQYATAENHFTTLLTRCSAVERLSEYWVLRSFVNEKMGRINIAETMLKDAIIKGVQPKGEIQAALDRFMKRKQSVQPATPEPSSLLDKLKARAKSRVESTPIANVMKLYQIGANTPQYNASAYSMQIQPKPSSTPSHSASVSRLASAAATPQADHLMHAFTAMSDAAIARVSATPRADAIDTFIKAPTPEVVAPAPEMAPVPAPAVHFLIEQPRFSPALNSPEVEQEHTAAQSISPPVARNLIQAMFDEAKGDVDSEPLQSPEELNNSLDEPLRASADLEAWHQQREAIADMEEQNELDTLDSQIGAVAMDDSMELQWANDAEQDQEEFQSPPEIHTNWNLLQPSAAPPSLPATPIAFSVPASLRTPVSDVALIPSELAEGQSPPGSTVIVLQPLVSASKSLSAQLGTSTFISPVRRTTRGKNVDDLALMQPTRMSQAALGQLLSKTGFAYFPNPALKAHLTPIPPQPRMRSFISEMKHETETVAPAPAAIPAPDLSDAMEDSPTKTPQAADNREEMSPRSERRARSARRKSFNELVPSDSSSAPAARSLTPVRRSARKSKELAHLLGTTNYSYSAQSDQRGTRSARERPARGITGTIAPPTLDPIEEGAERDRESLDPSQTRFQPADEVFAVPAARPARKRPAVPLFSESSSQVSPSVAFMPMKSTAGKRVGTPIMNKNTSMKY